jgi:spore coat protein U-like protein
MKIKLFLILMFLVSGNAFADCGYQLSIPTLSYGLGDNNPTMQGTFTLTRTKNGGPKCNNFFIAFTTGWSNDLNNRRLTNTTTSNAFLYYNLYKNSNSTGILKDANGTITSPNEVLFGTIGINQTVTLNYYFTLAPIGAGTPPRAGVFEDHISVQAYQGSYLPNQNYGLEDSKTLNLYVNVAQSIAISLVDTNAPHNSAQTSKTLDFGVLEENEQMSFDIRLVSNTAHILYVSSVNNGKLKRVGGSGSGSAANAEIAYEFYGNNSSSATWLGGSSSSNVGLLWNYNTTPAGGTRYPVRIKIKSVTNKTPGEYQDSLTLSVVSQ